MVQTTGRLSLFSAVGAAFFLLLLSGAGCTSRTQISVTSPREEAVEKTTAVEEALKASLKTFVLSGTNYAFSMNGRNSPEIQVQQGDRVRIEFTSDSGFHDWSVDGFNVATKKVQTGESGFVEFVADKKGTFEYYCSVGDHRVNGMRGNLIVE